MRPGLSSLLRVLGAAVALAPALLRADEPEAFPVTIRVDAGQPGERLAPIWRFFGYDEANFTTMRDGQKLLSELAVLGQRASAPVYIRCHHLLTSGDGVPALKWSSTGVYSEDAAGHPVYRWAILDGIFDTYVARGLRPYVEIGFMPEALSLRPDLYPHHPPPNERAPVDGGQAYPPKDYAKWGELVYQWALHCRVRYGAAEVSGWCWEVWNEPNILYWRGSPDDYFRLYDFAVDGLRRALPTAQVGGPETAGGPGGPFLAAFLAHCAHGTNAATGQAGAPLDFIAFHAKGRPRWVDGHVVMGLADQFRDIDRAFAVVASFPEYRRTPIVIGECDPEGCAACRTPADAYRNGTLYPSFTAASFGHLRELAEERGVNLRGALTWAFEFENQPYFAGFRALATNGIDLPILNLFRLYAKMPGRRLPAVSTHGIAAAAIEQSGVRAAADVSALASRSTDGIAVIVWHYHDEDRPGPAAQVTVAIDHPPPALRAAGERVQCFRIDDAHSNAYAAWLRAGSPQPPNPALSVDLARAGRLAEPELLPVTADAAGAVSVALALPRHGTVLLVWRTRIPAGLPVAALKE
jgi:xylan 1,4-beta-xylosidase